ncbi:MAG: TMEM14 family protein [Armatimonas sp.]
MLSTVKLVLFAYAAFLAVGGFLGFQEKGSVMSLIGGLVCAIIAVVGATMLPGKVKLGLGLGIAAAIIAAGRPLSTMSKGLKLWPGGALLGASALVFVLCIAAFVTAGKEAG